MTDDHTGSEQTLPLAEEVLRVERRPVETGRIRISTQVDEQQLVLDEQLRREDVVVERVRIGRYVEAPPEIRREGDVLIYPIVEEVVEKRLVLREELRITLKESVEPFHEAVTLRSQRAVIERTEVEPDPTQRD